MERRSGTEANPVCCGKQQQTHAMNTDRTLHMKALTRRFFLSERKQNLMWTTGEEGTLDTDPPYKSHVDHSEKARLILIHSSSLI